MDSAATAVIGLLFLTGGVVWFRSRDEIAAAQSGRSWLKLVMWQAPTRENLARAHLLASAGAVAIGLFTIVVAVLDAVGA